MPERIPEISETIRSGNVDWMDVVKLTSEHLVLPAIYINLMRSELVKGLPVDLIEFMDSVTQRNRDRNLQLLDQARDVSRILRQKQIEPIYLKGMALLLKPLYEDIGERMTGDIDCILNEEDVLPAVQLLEEAGYKPQAVVCQDTLKTLKHYPRLIKPGLPAGVEIHLRVVPPPHDRRFSYAEIERGIERVAGYPGMFIPSVRHLIIHNALNAQISDKASLYGNPSLRQMYDLFRLSKLADPVQVLEEFPYFRHQTQAWLMMTSKSLDYPEVYPRRRSWGSRLMCMPMNLLLMNYRIPFRSWRAIVYLSLRLGRYIKVLVLAAVKKNARKELVYKLRDPSWYPLHLNSYRSFFNPSIH